MSLSSQPFTLAALHETYRAGTQPADIVGEVFRRIEALADPGIFILLRDREAVLSDAESLGPFDPSRPLWGVPFVIKDNIDAAGLPTTAACPAYAYTADKDAFVVSRLRAAGALLIGKTNLDQFATGLVGVRSPYAPPLNALDPAIVPGGSSSGSAVSVAHGLVSFSLGTDTAGSGRVPAALNNIVGLKPTLGALSASGVVPAVRSLDTVSVFALTVEDAWRVFQSAAAFDSADSYSRRIPVGDIHALPERLTVAVPDNASLEFFRDSAQADMFASAVALLEAKGATIERVDFTPFYDVARMLYEGAWVAERFTVVEDLLTANPEALHPVTRAIISQAKEYSAADAFRGMYRLKALIREAEPILQSVDMLCVPSIPTFFSVADLEADPVTPNSRLGTYTNFVNLMDMCGLTVPTPARGDGRPGSVTLLAKAGRDADLAALATVIESAGARTLGATGWRISAPATQRLAKEEKTIDIAVCGAHMQGLALNHELTDRGAELVRETRTAPDYTFHALPGNGVNRPGLVRIAEGTGASVAVEVWRLPLDQVGSFLAGIPAPLCIGTTTLQDGSEVKGFLCEAAATTGAEDISHLADWRLYVARSGRRESSSS